MVGGDAASSYNDASGNCGDAAECGEDFFCGGPSFQALGFFCGDAVDEDIRDLADGGWAGVVEWYDEDDYGFAAGYDNTDKSAAGIDNDFLYGW